MSMRHIPDCGYLVPLDALLPHLSEADREEVLQFIEDGDWGAAAEVLCHGLDDTKFPTPDFVREFRDEDIIDEANVKRDVPYVLFSPESFDQYSEIYWSNISELLPHQPYIQAWAIWS